MSEVKFIGAGTYMYDPMWGQKLITGKFRDENFYFVVDPYVAINYPPLCIHKKGLSCEECQ